jgi:methionyl-tRNA formyltransferase
VCVLQLMIVQSARRRGLSLARCVHRSFSAGPHAGESRSRSGGLRVLFFGSDDFSVGFMHSLRSAGDLCSRLEVVTPPDSRKGRGKKLQPGELKVAAREAGVQVHSVAAAVDFRMGGYTLPYCDQDQSSNGRVDLSEHFDVGVVVSFGYFIPPWVINAFPLGMVNVHPSLLPDYRGAAPINRALLGHESQTGVSVQEVHPSAIDHGKVLVQAPLDVLPTHTYASLKHDLGRMGAESMRACLHSIHELRAQKSVVCVDPARDYPVASKITKAEGELLFASCTAEEIHWRWRAFSGYLPAFTHLDGVRINILDVELPFTRRQAEGLWAEAPAGTAWLDEDTSMLFVRCADGGVVAVSKLVAATKKPTTAAVFAKRHFGEGASIEFRPK